jgi:hypothetical protein
VIFADIQTLQNPKQGVIADRYYSMYLSDAKCGWVHSRLERKKDTVVSSDQMTLKLGRGDVSLTMTMQKETVETIDGKPISVFSRMDMPGSKTTYDVKFDGTKAKMKISQSGQSVEHRFTVPEETTLTWGDYLKTVEHLHQPGFNYISRPFEPELGPGNVEQTTITIGSKETFKIAGKTISGIRVVAQSETLGKIPISVIVDDKGFVRAMDVFLGGMKLQIVEDTKENALGRISTQEIFLNTFVKLKRPLVVNPDKTLVLKLSLMKNPSTTQSSEDALSEIPETGMQRVKKTNHSFFVELLPASMRNAPSNETPKPECLADSRYLNLSDPILKKLAKQAAGKAKTKPEIAKNVCRFVHEYIKTKNLSTAFASASETAKTRTGDCSEHTVLFVALMRLNNVPAQAVMGLVHINDIAPNGAFGYHFWAQVWDKNHWVDVDPTFGQFTPDQTHIALAVQTFADDSFIQSSAKVIQFIGRLKIEP